MSKWDDEAMRRAQVAEDNYRAWAERERAKGDAETADRLNKKADALHRTHGKPAVQPGVTAPKFAKGNGWGCVVILMAIATAPVGVWQIWELLA